MYKFLTHLLLCLAFTATGAQAPEGPIKGPTEAMLLSPTGLLRGERGEVGVVFSDFATLLQQWMSSDDFFNRAKASHKPCDYVQQAGQWKLSSCR